MCIWGLQETFNKGDINFDVGFVSDLISISHIDLYQYM